MFWLGRGTRVEQAVKNWEGEKFRAQSARKIFCSCPPTIPVIGDTCPFAPPPPVEAMHAVTIMSLKAIVLLSVGTVLTDVSFHRISIGPWGVKPLKSGRVKTYFRSLASKSSLPYSSFHPWGFLLTIPHFLDAFGVSIWALLSPRFMQ